MCAISLCEEFVLSKLCVLSRFTGVCLFPQLCGCRVCVSRFFCVFQAVPSPLLSHWQCQYQTAPRASMPQRRQSESITPDLWPHSFGKMFSFLSATLSLFLCCFLPFSFKSYLPIGLWIYIHNIVTWGSESGLFKEIVHPKNENSVFKYSPSCRSKPSFIFGTQIKMFLMISESYLILHRQQHWNEMFPGPER